MSRDLMISVAAKTGSKLLPDNEQWTFRLEVKSASSSRLYIVAKNKNTGEFGCSCPGWKFNRNCKHLKVMLPLIAAAEKAPNKIGGR